jgi:hypothetical protein
MHPIDFQRHWQEEFPDVPLIMNARIDLGAASPHMRLPRYVTVDFAYFARRVAFDITPLSLAELFSLQQKLNLAGWLYFNFSAQGIPPTSLQNIGRWVQGQFDDA